MVKDFHGSIQVLVGLCVFFVVSTEDRQLRCVCFGIILDVPDETMLQSYE